MNRKVVVYIVFKTLKSAGTRIAFEHADRLRKKGYETRIVSVFGKEPSWYKLDTPVYSVFSLFLMRDIHILVSTFWPLSYMMPFIKAYRKYIFLQGWEADFYKNKLMQHLVKYSIRMPYQKIVVSRYLKQKVSELMPGAKVHHINYLEIDRYIFKKRTTYKVNKNPQILSVISWYNKAKGPDLLVKAIKNIKKKYPHFKCTLISLENYPIEDIFDNFVSNPSQKIISKAYREADIFLVTSRSEGYFIPGLEAMASGCPMISTDCGGIHEYAVHKKNAIVIKSIDSLWRTSILDTIVSNKAIRNKIIKNGYETVRQYKWSRIIRSLEEIYFQ